MKLVDALCELGEVAGASTLSTLPPPICSTAIETIQRLAFTKRKDVLSDPPPCLFEETGMLSRVQLWSSGPCPLSDGYKSGPGLPPREATCIGGVVLQLNETVWKPATVMHRDDLILLFVPDCTFSILEQSLERKIPSELENYTYGAAYAAQTRRLLPQLMQHVRTGGACAMAPHLLSLVHLVRDGPLPWLRARSPASVEEKQALHELLCKFPVATPKSATTLLEKSGETQFRMQTILSRVKLAPLPNTLTTTAGKLVDAAIISPIALIILGQSKRNNKLLETLEPCSIDTTNEDEEGNPQIGSFFAVQKRAIALSETEEGEAAQLIITEPTPLPAPSAASADMAAPPLPPPVSVTLSQLAKLVQRKASVKQVACSFGVNGIEQLIVDVARPHDANLLRQMLDGLPRTTSAFDSLHQIIRMCNQKYAFLIVSVQGLHLFTPSHRYNIDADAAARLLLCPWVTTIIFDMGKVGVLTVDGVPRWSLTLDDAVRVSRLALNKTLPAEVSRAMQAAAASGEKMESLADRLEYFENNLAGQLAAVAASTTLQKAQADMATILASDQPNRPNQPNQPNQPISTNNPNNASDSASIASTIRLEGLQEPNSQKRSSSEELTRVVARRKLEAESSVTASWMALSDLA